LLSLIEGEALADGV
jgi:hypothetical protein